MCDLIIEKDEQGRQKNTWNKIEKDGGVHILLVDLFALNKGWPQSGMAE